MTVSLPVADHIAINEVINRFFWCLDHGNSERVGDLFTATAKLDLGRPGAPSVHGRDAIVEDVRNRPAVRLTRHLVTGVLIDAVDADHAHVGVVNAVFAGPNDDSKIREEIGMSDTALVMVKEGDGKWRFEDMKRTVIFKPQA